MTKLLPSKTQTWTLCYSKGRELKVGWRQQAGQSSLKKHCCRACLFEFYWRLTTTAILLNQVCRLLCHVGVLSKLLLLSFWCTLHFIVCTCTNVSKMRSYSGYSQAIPRSSEVWWTGVHKVCQCQIMLVAQCVHLKRLMYAGSCHWLNMGHLLIAANQIADAQEV